MLAVFLTLTTVFFSVFSISTRAAAPWDFDTEKESVMTADEGENSASPETAPEGSTAAEPDDNTPSEEGGTENDTDDKEDLAGTGITAEYASEQEPEFVEVPTPVFDRYMHTLCGGDAATIRLLTEFTVS